MKVHDSKFQLGLILGGVVGALSALFLTPTTGKQNREVAKKKMDEFNKWLHDEKIDEKVKEIFGEVTEETKKFYSDAKVQISAKISDLRENVDDLNMEKIRKIIGEVVDNMKIKGGPAIKHADKLKDRMMKFLAEEKVVPEGNLKKNESVSKNK